jgi:peptide/nickel transport system ATP-binding protein/oligopeptide transport system ATP-binding protein
MILQGEMPSALNPPSGCRFHTRCPFVIERCRTEVPQLTADGTGHAVSCHRAAELPSAAGIVPSDGGFSPALEKLVAAFSLSKEGPDGSGVDIVGRPTAV